MPTTIKLKNSVTTTNAPSSLAQGEVAINITDKKVWVGNAATTPIQLLGDGGSVTFTSLTVTGVSTFSAGTVSAPSITTSGDTNTGIFFPAADTIAFTEGGVESGRFTSTGALQLNNNLTFSGTGNRITGDFSNATIASRVAFQTSTTNSGTRIGALPNGTSLNSSFDAFANSDPTNSAYGRFGVAGATDVRIESAILGTGTYLPLTMYTGGSERVRIDTSGNVGIGAINSGTYGKLEVTGSSYQATAVRSTDASGVVLALAANSSNESRINTVSNHPMAFYTNNTERMRIDSSGNVGIGTSSPSTFGKLGVVSADGYITGVAGDTTTFTTYIAGDISYLCAGPRSGSNGKTLVFQTGSSGIGTERMRIEAGGNVLMNKSASSATTNGFEFSASSNNTLYVTSANDALILYRKTTTTNFGVMLTRSDVGGTGTVVGAAYANGTFAAISDINKKKNVEDARNYLDDVMKLRVVKYNWKTDEENASKELGWIAQEVENVFPSLISDMNGSKMLKKEVFLPMLMKCIQELNAKVEAQAAEIALLKSK
jgi:hypothetical protein